MKAGIFLSPASYNKKRFHEKSGREKRMETE
jgi:hypothetical protein